MSSNTTPTRHIQSDVWRRVALVAQRFNTHAEPDGGFGLTQTQASSLVNTAEVLSVLKIARSWGADVDLKVVDSALRYLALGLPDHCRQRSSTGGRGEKTRFALFTLEGLGLWPDRLQEQHVDTIRWAIRWLEDVQREDGLPEERGLSDASLFQTAVGIRALAPFCRNSEIDVDGRAPALVTQLSEALAQQMMSGGGWPSLIYGAKLSPAKSALAIIGLTAARRLDVIPDNLAFSYRSEPRPVVDAIAESCEVLIRSNDRWRRFIEHDPEVPGTQWSHLSYASCLEALATFGNTRDPRIASKWQDLYATWSTSYHAWREPTDPPTSTARADYATIRAFDAAIQDIGHSGTMEIMELEGQDVSHPRFDLLHTQVDQFYIRDSRSGSKYPVRLSRSQMSLLRSLIPPYGEPRYVGTIEIADALDVDGGSVGTMVRRLDSKLRESIPEIDQPKGMIQGQRGAGYRLLVGSVQKI